MDESVTFEPIGVIRTPFATPEGTPIQGGLLAGVIGNVEVFEEFAGGLQDVEGFSHLILIYHLHLVRGWRAKVKPFLDVNEHGVFATRSPARPNPIGISTVRLRRRTGNVLEVEDVDMVDGSPLLDIKPFVPDFDERADVQVGWYRNRIAGADPVADDRFRSEE